MGFGQGLSGLNAAAQSLDVIGNNIANSGTVGFKSASATFADVYASSRVGLGVKVAGINQRFNVGAVTGGGGQYDIAIDGAKGMFRVTDSSGSVMYTRNGEFSLDQNNFIVNAQGYNLTGYAGGAVGTNPVAMQLPTANVQPIATTTGTTVANLDANANVVTEAFDPTKPSSYTNANPISVFDSLGNSHQVMQYFAKRDANAAGESVYEVYYTVDGKAMQPSAEAGGVWTSGPAGALTNLRFDTSGRLLNTAPVALSLAQPGGTVTPAEPLAIAMDYTGTTQFGSAFATTMKVNGVTSGEFLSISISKNGELLAEYSNGQKRVVGTLALADFTNLQGLQPVGNNAWVETSASGQPTLGQPGTNGMASVVGQATEASNVDMSKELVNMIIAQRTYQANSQTIKTQDEIMQVLMNLK